MRDDKVSQTPDTERQEPKAEGKFAYSEKIKAEIDSDRERLMQLENKRPTFVRKELNRLTEDMDKVRKLAEVLRKNPDAFTNRTSEERRMDLRHFDGIDEGIINTYGDASPEELEAYADEVQPMIEQAYKQHVVVPEAHARFDTIADGADGLEQVSDAESMRRLLEIERRKLERMRTELDVMQNNYTRAHIELSSAEKKLQEKKDIDKTLKDIEAL